MFLLNILTSKLAIASIVVDNRLNCSLYTKCLHTLKSEHCFLYNNFARRKPCKLYNIVLFTQDFNMPVVAVFWFYCKAWLAEFVVKSRVILIFAFRFFYSCLCTHTPSRYSIEQIIRALKNSYDYTLPGEDFTATTS